MTADVELLPLPDHGTIATKQAEGIIKAWATDYARANVEHHTAAKDAEIKALRAEVQFLRSHRPIARKSAQAEARAERLAEALLNVLTFAEHADNCGDSGAYNHADVRTCGCGLDGIREHADELLHPTAAQVEG